MPDQISSIRENVIDPNSWDETSRRIRAAIAWKGSSKQFGRRGAAEAMNVEPGEVDRMTGTKPGEQKMPTWDQRWALARAVGLPEEWFSADLSRLHEIVPEGMPRFNPPTSDEPADGLPLVGELGRRAQGSGRTSERHEPAPKKPARGAGRGKQ